MIVAVGQAFCNHCTAGLSWILLQLVMLCSTATAVLRREFAVTGQPTNGEGISIDITLRFVHVRADVPSPLQETFMFT